MALVMTRGQLGHLFNNKNKIRKIMTSYIFIAICFILTRLHSSRGFMRMDTIG
jgi:hypothetical protein